MLKPKMEKAFNAQINAELYSSYLYLAMAAYFQSLNLPGFVNWMKCQALEELYHAMKIYDFVAERGGRVKLEAVKKPAESWKSPLAAFQEVYAHETKVTGLINNLVDLAIREKDHAAHNFLQWFVAEQVEEESGTDAVVQKLKLAGDGGPALFMIDQELATRVVNLQPDIKVTINPAAAAG